MNTYSFIFVGTCTMDVIANCFILYEHTGKHDLDNLGLVLLCTFVKTLLWASLFLSLLFIFIMNSTH